MVRAGEAKADRMKMPERTESRLSKKNAVDKKNVKVGEKYATFGLLLTAENKDQTTRRHCGNVINM